MVSTPVRKIFATLAVAPLLLLAACGNGGSDALKGGSSGGGSGTKVVIAGQAFTESEIMSEMYAALLQKAGFSPSIKTVQTRDVYTPLLEKGDVDVSADYLSSMTEFLNRAANGANAKPVASSDVNATLAQLKKLGSPKNITPLKPAQAEDANAYAVTKKFADQNHLTTLSDLGAMGKPITLAAASDCSERPECGIGLKKTYGLKITKIEPLEFDTVQTKNAVKSGEVTLGQVATSDGTLASLGLVVLEDDKNLQSAENLVPVVNSDFLKKNPQAATALDKLASVLTTDDLKKLNAKVDVDREKAKDVADQYLKQKGLI
jgi:osmoprotectant transport system substrate-binding protein